MYKWTVALRDALIKLELAEMPGTFADNDQEAAARYTIASLTALTSIPIGTELVPSGDELDDDVEPGPTADWIEQLVQFYYGNGPLPS